MGSNTSVSRPPSLSIVNSCNNRVNSVIASGTSSSSVVSTDQIVSPKSHNQNRLEQCTNIPLDREGTINFDKNLSCEKFSTTEDTAILRGAQTFGVDNPGIKLIHSLMFPIPILDGNCHRREGKRNEAKKINMTENDLHLRYKELKKRIDIVVTSKLKEHVERSKNIESGNKMKTVVKPSIFEHSIIDRNQSDLRRSQLKSCKKLLVEQTKNSYLCINCLFLIQHRGQFKRL